MVRKLLTVLLSLMMIVTYTFSGIGYVFAEEGEQSTQQEPAYQTLMLNQTVTLGYNESISGVVGL